MWGVHPKVLELIRTDSLIKPEVQSRKSKWKKKKTKTPTGPKEATANSTKAAGFSSDKCTSE